LIEHLEASSAVTTVGEEIRRKTVREEGGGRGIVGELQESTVGEREWDGFLKLRTSR
jgi:hypothetical protein